VVIPNDYLYPESQMYGYTGEAQFFMVPGGVHEILVECWGAGSGDDDYVAYGGYAAAYINVWPGHMVVLQVGGSDGYNGGGSRGTDNSGGGATDVRYGGTTLDDRKLVAGGAGGPTEYQPG
jgi:hypothetical protein